MTLMEFAIARTFAQICEIAKSRTLTKNEVRLLAKLTPCIERYRARDVSRRKSPAAPPTDSGLPASKHSR
jgi:hypothetical protein